MDLFERGGFMDRTWKVVVAEDHRILRAGLKAFLQSRDDIEVREGYQNKDIYRPLPVHQPKDRGVAPE